jgi:hypothetical protein
MKYAVLVIYKSANGRDGWVPVAEKDVPAWVKKPETIGRLIKGEACMKADEGKSGSEWYRARSVVSEKRVTH